VLDRSGHSVRARGDKWYPPIRRNPLVICLKFQTELLVEDPQITIGAALDRFGDNCLHFLRHDADIRRVAAVVDEPIEAEAVVEASKQGDVVLEPYIGPPTPATATTSSTPAPATTPATATTSAAYSRPTTTASARPTPAEARPAAIGFKVGYSSGTDIAKSSWAATASRTTTAANIGAIAAAARPVAATTDIWTVAAARSIAATTNVRAPSAGPVAATTNVCAPSAGPVAATTNVCAPSAGPVAATADIPTAADIRPITGTGV